MKKKPHLIPLLNFFAETLRETLEESSLSQAEIARRCGIPAPHLNQMKQGKRRCTPEYDLRLAPEPAVGPDRRAGERGVPFYALTHFQAEYEQDNTHRPRGNLWLLF